MIIIIIIVYTIYIDRYRFITIDRVCLFAYTYICSFSLLAYEIDIQGLLYHI